MPQSMKSSNLEQMFFEAFFVYVLDSTALYRIDAVDRARIVLNFGFWWTLVLFEIPGLDCQLLPIVLFKRSFYSRAHTYRVYMVLLFVIRKNFYSFLSLFECHKKYYHDKLCNHFSHCTRKPIYLSTQLIPSTRTSRQCAMESLFIFSLLVVVYLYRLCKWFTLKVHE